MEPAAILGPDGSIARRLERYEQRPQQLQMADAVARALAEKRHLVVEAGTGTGKSFAYLVPAILHATREVEEGDGDEERGDEEKPAKLPVVISTHTISLQEQLLNKDIPLLRSVMPQEFTAVLAKGRGNYLSLRRMQRAQQRSMTLFSIEQQDQLQQIAQWTKSTTDGSLSSLKHRPQTSVWDEVASDHSNCLGRQCPTYKKCFYYAARRRVQNADLIVVNHALFFTDLALRASGASILPNYSAVIFDEAHTMESVAGDHLGIRLNEGQIEYALNKLYNDRTTKGLLVPHNLIALQKEVERCRFMSSDLFTELQLWYESGKSANGRVHEAKLVTNALSETLSQLSVKLHKYGSTLEEVSERKEFIAASERLETLGASLHQWNEQTLAGSVYWVESTKMRSGARRIELAAAPIDIGAQLDAMLFKKVPSVILASATLATGKTGNFEFFRKRIGLKHTRELCVGSPFNYRDQAQIVLVKGMPDPSLKKEEYDQRVPELVKQHVALRQGHAFALFTSFQSLRRCEEAIAPWLYQRGLALYSQAGT